MATITGLHLQYRLWIADINSDVDVLRILNDYVADKLEKDNTPDVLNNINYFKEEFSKLRKEMDELRHEMHLNKMTLAPLIKESNQSVQEVENSINHKTFKERYETFRTTFSKIKNEFQDFENK